MPLNSMGRGRLLALPWLLTLPKLFALRHMSPMLCSRLSASSSCYYYTVRHTFEQELMDELALAGVASTTVCPGLVRCAESFSELDPTYALQVLPEAEEISADTTAALVRACLASLKLEERAALQAAPRGALAVHSLVPDMFKGSPKPKMAARADRISAAVTDALRARFSAARKPMRKEGAADSSVEPNHRWLLQLLLLEPDRLVASLSRCTPSRLGGSWPNWRRAAGLAPVDIPKSEQLMPSSAYRKLLEAIDLTEIEPSREDRAIDLGACPGGWTQALRRYGCSVVAVDRSVLAPELMRDRRVEFIKGDAFSFTPEPPLPVDLLVSDVIAYPDRVLELLGQWCEGRWARRLIVTMKFQGGVAWDELREAERLAESHGFACRTKHFFNNKNEVTFMLADTRPSMESTAIERRSTRSK